MAKLRDLLDDSFGTKWFWPRYLIDEGLAREILRILLADSPGWRLFRLYTPEEHRQGIIDEYASKIHALGAEIYNPSGEYSWHCNDLAIEIEKRFGFKLGPWGLLTDLEQARLAAEGSLRKAMPNLGLWIPIALCPVDS